MLSPQGRKWLRNAALKEQNPYLAAEIWYRFFDETEPYPMRRMKEHFPVFNKET